MGLKGYRNYNTTDSEPYYEVTVACALSDALEDMGNWPKVRMVTPELGEVREGGLMWLMDAVAELIGGGFAVTLYPLDDPQGGGEGMNYPEAWEISNATPPDQHHEQCSVRWGMLCDCEVLTQHPRYIEDYGKEKE